MGKICLCEPAVSGFGCEISRYEWYHNCLDSVPGLLECALSGQVFKNLPGGHVWSGSSAQSDRGRWNRRRTTWVTSACTLPRTPPTGPTGVAYVGLILTEDSSIVLLAVG